VLALLLLATLSAAEPAPNPYLAQAKVLYQGLEFEKALARLKRAETWKKNTARDTAEISLYRGLCRYQQGDERGARAELRRALQRDATLELPPLTSPKIRAVFDEELAAVQPGSGAPTQPAGSPAVTPAANAAAASAPAVAPLAAPSASTSIAPAALAPPPGKAGPPALSKNPTPWLIAAGSAAAFVAAGGLFAYSATRNASAANAAPYASDAIPLSRAAQQDATIANVLFGASAAAVAAGVTLYFVF
jgi:tetratricopeptide (TPR) repeat protein